MSLFNINPLQTIEVDIVQLRIAYDALRQMADELKSRSDDPAAHKDIDDQLNRLRSRIDDLEAQARDKGKNIQVGNYVEILRSERFNRGINFAASLS